MILTKKWMWTIAASCFAAGTAAAAAALLHPSNDLTLPEISFESPAETDQPATTSAVEPVIEPLPMPARAYLLKLANDVLGVYMEGDQLPFETYEMTADWLPDYDRVLLEYGLRVQSETELRILLEDYLS